MGRKMLGQVRNSGTPGYLYFRYAKRGVSYLTIRICPNLNRNFHAVYCMRKLLYLRDLLPAVAVVCGVVMTCIPRARSLVSQYLPRCLPLEWVVHSVETGELRAIMKLPCDAFGGCR
jgi:hypothetical protein